MREIYLDLRQRAVECWEVVRAVNSARESRFARDLPIEKSIWMFCGARGDERR